MLHYSVPSRCVIYSPLATVRFKGRFSHLRVIDVILMIPYISIGTLILIGMCMYLNFSFPIKWVKDSEYFVLISSHFQNFVFYVLNYELFNLWSISNHSQYIFFYYIVYLPLYMIIHMIVPLFLITQPFRRRFRCLNIQLH